jgi:hypothetical protein
MTLGGGYVWWRCGGLAGRARGGGFGGDSRGKRREEGGAGANMRVRVEDL